MMSDRASEFPCIFEHQKGSSGSGRSAFILLLGLGLGFVLIGFVAFPVLNLDGSQSAFWPVTSLILGIASIILAKVGLARFPVLKWIVRVEVGDGWVRVCKQDGPTETDVLFEAPYSEFRSVLLLDGFDADAESDDCSVFLVHEAGREISLLTYFTEEGALDHKDKLTLKKLSSEIGIPVRRPNPRQHPHDFYTGNTLSIDPDKCPNCGHVLREAVVVFCPECWSELPPNLQKRMKAVKAGLEN